MSEQHTSPQTEAERKIAEVAREWLVYLYSQDADDRGRANFSEWLNESPGHAAAYAKAEKLWRDIAWIEDIDADLSNQGFAATGNRVADGHSSWWSGWFARPQFIAAGLAASLIAAAGLLWMSHNNSVDVQQFATGTGVDKQQTVLLADGTQITLDAASTIVARFSKKRRDVELLRGSAYFDVENDSERPFRVLASGSEVRVLGTEFDIRRRSNDIQISVTEGVVQVSPVLEKSSEVSNTKQVKLAAGQQVLAAFDGGISEVSDFNATRVLAWREGRLVYDNARLADIISDINRYRLKKIELADAALSEIRVTTAFGIDQSDQVLAGLSATKPVIIEDQGFRVIIRSKDR